jgi:hypothetical protein
LIFIERERLKSWKLNPSRLVKGIGRSKILRVPLIMIIEEMGSLVVASVRGGAAKRYYEAKNSDLECEGAK